MMFMKKGFGFITFIDDVHEKRIKQEFLPEVS